MRRLGHASTVAAYRYLHAVDGRDAEIAAALSTLAAEGSAAKLPCSVRDLGEGHVGCTRGGGKPRELGQNDRLVSDVVGSIPHVGASGSTCRRVLMSARSTSSWNVTHQRPAFSRTVVPRIRARPSPSRSVNQARSSRVRTFPGTRSVCLPVACRRGKGKGTTSTVDLACQMIEAITARLPGRTVHVVADAAYHGKQVKTLPERVTWTTRLPRNAALYGRVPGPTGKRGRPRLKGDKLGNPAEVAAGLVFQPTEVARYGRTETVRTAVIDCLWSGTFGPLPVRMIRVRDRDETKAPMLALITTDLNTTVTDLVARYAMRWSIEVTFFDCRQTLGQTLGVGQARNRTAQAVERTFAFGMYVYSLIVIWYAISGHRPEIVTQRRIQEPWYLSKTDPSFADMLTTLRHTITATRFMPIRPAQLTDEEIRQVQRAWALAAA